MLNTDFLKAWNLLKVDTVCTLLLSGGGDSVALFHLLKKNQIPFRALHFVHDGNQEFAKKSEIFCRSLCCEHKVPFESVRIEGREIVILGDLSWEAACRKLRYDFLKHSTGIYLTAHTLDDQAETVLMRLLDGAGLDGLSGIQEHRQDGVTRPLLGITRAALRNYLTESSLAWLEDPSNVDGNDRARLRGELIPKLLEERPHLRKTLGRTARRLRNDSSFLQQSTAEWIERHTLEGGDSWELASVQALPQALLSRFIRRIWREIGDANRRPRGTLFEECSRLLKRGSNGGQTIFPNGSSVIVLGEKVWAKPTVSDTAWQFSLESHFDLETPYLKISKQPLPDTQSLVTLYLDDECCLRNRLPGDTFKGRALKKCLASLPHPPWVRDRWPVLALGKEILDTYPFDSSSASTNGTKLWLDFNPYFLRTNLLSTNDFS